MTNPQFFDVFLSHNSRDKAQVRAVAAQLRLRGLNPWLDEEQLIPGQPWQAILQDDLSNIKSLAIFIGSNDFSPWQSLELHAFFQKFIESKLSIIPVILPRVSRASVNIPLFLKGFSYVDFNQWTHEKAIDMLVRGITGKTPQPKLINRFEHVDVLLCYRQVDQPEVGHFSKQLEEYQISFYPNKWELDASTTWRDLFTKLVYEINSLAVFVGNNGAPWEDEEVEDLIWKFIEDGHTVIPVILPKESRKNKLAIIR